MYLIICVYDEQGALIVRHAAIKRTCSAICLAGLAIDLATDHDPSSHLFPALPPRADRVQ